MRRNSPAPIIAAAAAVALAVLPAPAWSQSAAPAAQNQAWAARLTALLRLTPPQQAAFKAFLETSARSADVMAPSAAQIRAMTMVQQFDQWADQTIKIQTRAQADATALHRFYETLTPEQRAKFDEETRSRVPPPNIAADVTSAAAPEKPDFRLPAHTEPDWLVKPTAENIARVFPAAAVKAQIGGRAILHCRVDVDGYLADCTVLSEEPQGQGFGNAALEITAYMRMQPATNYGVPVEGDVRVPITFAKPDPE